MDLIAFEEDETQKMNLDSVIFDLQIDVSFNYKSMIFDKSYARELRSTSKKIQNDTAHSEIIKEIQKCLSDDVKVILMGPRIYGTTDKNSILDIGIVGGEGFDLFDISGKVDIIDVLLSKTESFFAADCHNYKVMAKFQSKSSVYVYLWRNWKDQLMRKYFTTEFLKYWFTCQPESKSPMTMMFYILTNAIPVII